MKTPSEKVYNSDLVSSLTKQYIDVGLDPVEARIHAVTMYSKYIKTQPKDTHTH